MEKKEPFRKRFGFSLAITFCLLIVVYLLKIEVNVFLLLMTKSLFSVILMVFFLHSCWEMSWTVAIYDAIWAMALWLMLCEDWQVIRVLILKKWGGQWLFLLFFFGLLFAFGHLVCAYTIAKWMPKDRKEKLGPRQMTSAILIYLLILFLQIFIGSASAKIMLIMPIILPICKTIGISPTLVILTYCMADGFTDVILPTNPVLLIGLSMAGVSYWKWLKWTWKLQLLLFAISILVLLFGVAIGY